MRTPEQAWSEALAAAPQIMVVTGDIGGGKTTWCTALIEHVGSQGASAAGLLCPGVFKDGRKVAVDVIDLVSQEKRRLAKRRAVNDSSSPTPKWDFDSDVLAWGNQVLEKIVGADLLLIDELGPLELLKGKGWQAGIRLLEGGSYRVACVVVRRELLNVMLARFPNAVIAAELTREEGDQTTSDSSSD